MPKRYTLSADSILDGCLITPDVYEGILERFESFVAPFIKHLHKRVQQQKAIDYMKGLMSDVEERMSSRLPTFMVQTANHSKILSDKPNGMMR